MNLKFLTEAFLAKNFNCYASFFNLYLTKQQNQKGPCQENTTLRKSSRDSESESGIRVYADAAAFISDIVLRADEFDQFQLERLRREIQLGLDQLNRGEGIPLNMDEINQAAADELGRTKWRRTFILSF